MIQIRNVPESMHRERVRRARKRGLALTDYLKQVLARELARPPAEEVFERIASRTRVDLGMSAAELIRRERADRPANEDLGGRCLGSCGIPVSNAGGRPSDARLARAVARATDVAVVSVG